MNNIPKTMRAIIHTQSTQSLRLETRWPVPTPKANEYLIKVIAAAITTGELYWPRPSELDQSTPGVELSGTIMSTPSTTTPKFIAGDRIYMRVPFPVQGGMRDYTTALQKDIALKPKDLSAIEAASVPLSALTAWQGLFQYAGLQPSFDSSQSRKERILIIGASSGCGIFFIQLARLAGYHVTGVCSTKNISFVQGLGANEVVDYTTCPVAECGKFDVVFDCVGGKSFDDGWRCVAQNGRLFTIVPPSIWNYGDAWELEPPEGLEKGVTGRLYIMDSDGEQLALITKLFEDGRLHTRVDSVWKLEEYDAAFERLGTQRAVGKVVVDVAGED